LYWTTYLVNRVLLIAHRTITNSNQRIRKDSSNSQRLFIIQTEKNNNCILQKSNLTSHLTTKPFKFNVCPQPMEESRSTRWNPIISVTQWVGKLIMINLPKDLTKSMSIKPKNKIKLIIPPMLHVPWKMKSLKLLIITLLQIKVRNIYWIKDLQPHPNIWVWPNNQ
jgi:hypothetical protein